MSDPLAVAVRDAVAEAVDMQFWGVVDLGILTGSLRDAGVRVTGDASLRETPLVTGDADGTRTRATYVAPSEYAPLADILLAHVLPDGSERSEAAEFARRLRPHLVVAPPNHPDDGHVHSFGCRLCGVDAPPSAAAALEPDYGYKTAAPYSDGGNWPPSDDAAPLRALVNEQAEDEGLWFIAHTAPEAYLQQELRRLHAAVEAADAAAHEDRSDCWCNPTVGWPGHPLGLVHRDPIPRTPRHDDCGHEWRDHGPHGCEARYSAGKPLDEDGVCSCLTIVVYDPANQRPSDAAARLREALFDLVSLIPPGRFALLRRTTRDFIDAHTAPPEADRE